MPPKGSINFYHMVQRLGTGIFRCTPGPKGRVTYANKATVRFFGFKDDAVDRVFVKDLFVDPGAFQTFCRDARETGRVTGLEARLKGPGRKRFWGAMFAVAVRDRQGRPKEIDVVVHDITLQKTVEQELIESKELFQTIFDNTAAAIFVTDTEDRVVAWNPFMEKLLGWNREELFNKPMAELYPPQEWERIRGLGSSRQGLPVNTESRIYKRGGRLLDVSVSLSRLKDVQGRSIGLIGIMQDITERKLAHELLIQSKLAAEEANKAKSMFLASMSHEVRTPMNAILGMIDLTLETSLSEEQKDNLMVAKEAADNLLGLLNDILDLSKVESGRITLENIEFHLPNVVRSICKGFAVVARDKGLEVSLEVAEGTPDIIEGDPVRLRQILTNLINNAIKFTSKGGILVRIQPYPEDASGETLLFSVKDDGIGIPEDRQDKVFDVFTQADDSTTRRFGGTGLGLAICKRLVEMMGGQIWVESQVAKGSTFFFTARFRVVEQDHRSYVRPPKGVDRRWTIEELVRARRGVRVLLAEDNLVNQKITTRILEKQGLEVATVVNGKEAVEKLHQEKYDIVLMDSQMPEMDGLEATRIIRDNERHTGRHIPIIALTARAMEDDRKRCLEAGMDGYVAKPIDRKKLFEEIINCLEGESHE